MIPLKNVRIFRDTQFDLLDLPRFFQTDFVNVISKIIQIITIRINPKNNNYEQTDYYFHSIFQYFYQFFQSGK